MESPADLLTPTLPSECALALAVPLTIADFCDDLRAGSKMDYARHVCDGRPADRAWRDSGAPVAAVCEELAGVAKRRGVRVARKATLGELASMFQAFPVVSIAAHWRGPWLKGADFLIEPVDCVARLSTAADANSKELFCRLKASSIDAILAIRDPATRRAEFANLLNSAVVGSRRPLTGCFPSLYPGVKTVVDNFSLESEHRRLLEAALPEAFVAGNCLELRDGLHGIAELIPVVPEEWTGVIDLICCHSSYLAHGLKGGRARRRVIMTSRKVVPTVRLPIQKVLYNELAERGGNYVYVLVQLLSAHCF